MTLSDPCLVIPKILKSNPESLLVIRVKHLSKKKKERIRQRLIVRGIQNNRLKILERVDSNSHLKMYGEVDVALDPIPTEAQPQTIWMGVPVVVAEKEWSEG